MRTKIVIGATVLALAGLLLAGCGGVDQEDIDAADDATAVAEAATAALQSGLTAAEAARDAVLADEAVARGELTDLQWAIIDLEDLAADREAARIAALPALTVPDPTGDVREGSLEPATFTYTTYTDDTYGYTIAYEAAWQSGGTSGMTTYGQYERIGGGAYTVPALGINPSDFEAVDSPDYDPDELKVSDYDDHGAYVLAERDDLEEVHSTTEGVLVNGTPVTIYYVTYLGDFPGWDVSMYVDVNGTGITFTVSGDFSTGEYANAWEGIDDYVESSIELLMSLDF